MKHEHKFREAYSCTSSPGRVVVEQCNQCLAVRVTQRQDLPSEGHWTPDYESKTTETIVEPKE